MSMVGGSCKGIGTSLKLCNLSSNNSDDSSVLVRVQVGFNVQDRLLQTLLSQASSLPTSQIPFGA